MKVTVHIEMNEDGEIQLSSSVKDGGMVMLVLEKAKLELLKGINLKQSSIIKLPGNGRF